MKVALGILYDGYREYMLKVKGYATCASRTDVVTWEKFKKIIFDSIEEKCNGQERASTVQDS